MNDALETELLRHLHVLSEDIGPRPIGSPANHAAARYIATAFQAAGLAVETLEFPCDDWKHEETFAAVHGEWVAAAANMYSPPCDVTAPLVAVGTMTELEAAHLEGKVALLYGDLSSAPLVPKGYAVYPVERDQHINALLEAKRPVALLTVNHKAIGLERLIEDKDLAIPSATVSARAALHLLDRIGDPMHLRIHAQRTASSSAHVVGTKAGARPERIVLCAHYDTKIETPGAWDNGSGVAALLALAGMLTRDELPVGLEFVAFSDEEYTGMDDIVYMQRRGHLLDTVQCAFNIDGVGLRLASNSIMIASASPELEAAAREVTAAFPALQWVEPYPQSNHSTFAWRGVPAFAFSSQPYSPYAHLPEDTLEWLSGPKLAEVVECVRALVTRIASEPLTWARAAVEA